MNTLVGDLKTLIDKHLSTTEDLFINNQIYNELKTLKKAIKTLNWKSILYFLHRYQKSILGEAYSVARCVDNDELAKIFESMSGTKVHVWNRYEKFEYLAKTGQYDKLDQMKVVSSHGAGIKILSGLVIRGDLETIKSGRYGNLLIRTNNIVTQGRIIYKIYKHNRTEILEYIKNNGIIIDPNTNLRAKLMAKQTISAEDAASLNISSGHYVIMELTRSNYHNYVEQLILNNPDSIDVILAYIEGLISGNWIDKLEQFIANTTFDQQTIINTIVKTSIKYDKVELFKRYISNLKLERCSLSNNSFNILTWIVDAKMQINLDVEYIVDPRMIKMLYTFVQNGGRIVVDYNLGRRTVRWC